MSASSTISQASGPHVYVIPGAGDGDKAWRIEKVESEGFYRIIHVADSLCLQAPKTPGPDLCCESHVPVRLAPYEAGDRTMLWTLEAVRDEPVDRLAVSQVGWAHKAPKFAMLIRRECPKLDPLFIVARTMSDDRGLLELVEFFESRAA